MLEFADIHDHVDIVRSLLQLLDRRGSRKYYTLFQFVTLRWVETRQLLPLLRSRLPETWSVTPTQVATVVGEE